MLGAHKHKKDRLEDEIRAAEQERTRIRNENLLLGNQNPLLPNHVEMDRATHQNQERLAELDDLLEDLEEQLAATQRLQEANSPSIVVPPEPEADQFMPPGQPNYSEIIKICKPAKFTPEVYKPMFQKLFRYGTPFFFTHEVYRTAISNLLEGNDQTELSLRIQWGYSLQQLVDHFLLKYGTLYTPQQAMHLASQFQRLPGENIRSCMQRFEALQTQAQLQIHPQEHSPFRTQIMVDCLMRNLGPLTKQAVQTFQQNNEIFGEFLDYDMLLTVAYNSELHNHECGPQLYVKQLNAAFNNLSLQHVDVDDRQDRDQYDQELQAVAMTVPPVPSGPRRPNIYVKQEPRLYPNNPNFFSRNNRPRSNSRDRPPPPALPYAAPRPPSVPMPQPAAPPQVPALTYEPSVPRPPTPGAGALVPYQRAYDQNGSRVTFASALPPFIQPAMLPQHMDYNAQVVLPAPVYPYNVQQQIADRSRRDRWQQSGDNSFGPRGYSNDRGANQRDNSQNRMSFNRNSDSWQMRGQDQSWYRNNRSQTPTDQRGPPYQQPYSSQRQPDSDRFRRDMSNDRTRNFSDQNRQRFGRDFSRDRNNRFFNDSRQRSQSRDRFQSNSTWRNGRSDRPFQREPSKSPGPNRFNRSQSYERVRGVHIPTNFSQTNDKFCTKCGGQNDNGRILFETGHQDDACMFYKFWNPDRCTICEKIGRTAKHYERACLRSSNTLN